MIIGNILPVNKQYGDFVVTGDLKVGETLTVTGTTTLSGSTTIVGDLTVIGDNYNYGETYIVDPITVVNYLSGAPISGVVTRYAGLEVDRGLLTNYRIVFDENDDYFKVGEIGSEQIVATRTDDISDDEIVLYDTTTKQLSGSGVFLSTVTGDISTNASNIATNSSLITGLQTISGDHETRIVALEDGAILDGRFVNVTGDTMTGTLTVSGGDLFTDGSLGVGELTPLGKLHVKNGDSGATVNSLADELVIENSTDTGFTILSGTGSSGYISFGDSDNNGIGSIQYSHATNSLVLATNGQGQVWVDGTGKVGIGTTPNYRFQVHETASATTSILSITTADQGTVAGLDIGYEPSGTGGYIDVPIAFRIATDSIERIRVDSSGLNLNTNPIINVADPTNAQDAATKNWVQTNFSAITGTPVDNQLAVWTSATNIEGGVGLTYDGTTLEVATGVAWARTDNTGRLSLNNSANQIAYQSKINGDAEYRFQINTQGQLGWGPGSAVQDTLLYRNGVGALATNGSFYSTIYYVGSATEYISNSANVLQLTDNTNGTITLTQIATAIDNYTDVNGDTYLGTLSFDSTVASIDATGSITSTQSTDEILIRDASDSNFLKTITVSDFGAPYVAVAGDTVTGVISIDSTTGSIDATSAITSPDASDEILIRDASDSNRLKTITVDNFGAVKTFTDTTVGDGSTNPITITHNLGSQDVYVVVRDNSTNELVNVATTASTTNSISLDFTTTATTNQYTVKVLV